MMIQHGTESIGAFLSVRIPSYFELTHYLLFTQCPLTRAGSSKGGTMKTIYSVESVEGSTLNESTSYNCVMWWLWFQSRMWRIVNCKIEWTSQNVPSVKKMIYIVERTE